MLDRTAARNAALSLLVVAVSASSAAATTATTTDDNYCGAGAVTCSDPFFAGAITASSAGIWARTTAAAPVSVRYAKTTKPDNWITLPAVQTAADADFTARFQLTGLIGHTAYVYQIGVGQPGGQVVWSPSAWFRTAHAAPTSVTFSVLADFANKLADSRALRTATATPNDFVMFIGDLDHRNPGQDADGAALPPNDPDALANMRRMHQDTRKLSTALGADFYNGLIASTATKPQTPFYYGWDDHDYCTNIVGDDCANRAYAFQSYRENYLWSADTGLSAPTGCESDSQRVSYGKLLDVFVLDARSNRRHDDTTVTMLGSCQLNWLLEGLRTSKATWKFVMSPVPFNNTTKPYDAWGYFPDERATILNTLQAAQIKNVIILSADIHSGGAFDDGTHSGAPEFSVPHANMPRTWVNTYCRLDYNGSHLLDMTDDPGTWTVGTMTAPNTSPDPTCLTKTYPGAKVILGTAGPYPLDGIESPGYVRVELTPKLAKVTVFASSGVVRKGVLADGSTASLALKFPVAKK